MHESLMERVPVDVDFSKAPSVPCVVKSTTVTLILDATGAIGPKFAQLCDYEPNRMRLVVTPIDQDVVVAVTQPVASPDTSSATVAPQGTHVAKVPAFPFVTMGPDAFWVNSIAGTTRVTVLREYK